LKNACCCLAKVKQCIPENQKFENQSLTLIAPILILLRILS
jgi:hypothetical protein